MAKPKPYEVVLAILSGIGQGRLREQQQKKMKPAEDPTLSVLQELAKDKESPYQAWALEKLGLSPVGSQGLTESENAIGRMSNISAGMTPSGQPVGGTPIKQFPAWKDTAPPSQGMSLQPQEPGPEITPAPTVGVTPGTTPEERSRALIQEAHKGGLTTKQYTDFVKTTPDYKGRLQMGYGEAVNHFSNLSEVDPEGAEEFRALWEGQNKSKGLKLYVKPEKESRTTGQKDVRSSLASAIKDDITLIKENPRWEVWQNRPDDPNNKKVRWLQDFRIRILRDKATQKDWDIYNGKLPGPWEE